MRTRVIVGAIGPKEKETLAEMLLETMTANKHCALDILANIAQEEATTKRPVTNHNLDRISPGTLNADSENPSGALSSQRQ